MKIIYTPSHQKVPSSLHTTAMLLKEGYDEVDFALIIHKTINDAAEQTCIDILNILGVKCLVYDPVIEWPERIPGFLVIEYLLYQCCTKRKSFQANRLKALSGLWCGPGSNRRHKDFQSFALPTELPHLR
jgi:hypothetical protein